jgi:hypothetical protein
VLAEGWFGPAQKASHEMESPASVAIVPVCGVMCSSPLDGLFATLESKVKRLRLVSLHMGALFQAKKALRKTPSRLGSGAGLPLPGIFKASWIDKHSRSAVAVLVLMIAFRSGVPVDLQVVEAWANVELMKRNVAERQIQLLVCWAASGSEPHFDEFRTDFAVKHPEVQSLVVDQADMAPSVARLEDTCLKMAAIHYTTKVRSNDCFSFLLTHSFRSVEAAEKGSRKIQSDDAGADADAELFQICILR